MGQLKNILIDAVPALQAVEKKIEAMPETVLDGWVDSITFNDGSYLVTYALDVENEAGDGDWETEFKLYVVTDGECVEVETAEFELLNRDALDLSEHIPDLMEQVNE